jgi:hypothetical protein
MEGMMDNIVQSYIEEIDRRGEAIAQLRASNAKLIAEAKEARALIRMKEELIRIWHGPHTQERAHAELLAAAKRVINSRVLDYADDAMRDLKAAISRAEEPAP